MTRNRHTRRCDVRAVTRQTRCTVVARIRTREHGRHRFARSNGFVVKSARVDTDRIAHHQSVQDRPTQSRRCRCIIDFVVRHRASDGQTRWRDVSIDAMQSSDLVIACVSSRERETRHIDVLVRSHVFI